jgi:hypothetical protein
MQQFLSSIWLARAPLLMVLSKPLVALVAALLTLQLLFSLSLFASQRLPVTSPMVLS